MIYSMTAFARVETMGFSGMGNTFCKPTLFRDLFSFARTVSLVRARFARALQKETSTWKS